MPAYIASIDQGTTSTRCVIFDHDGVSIACAQKEHRQIYLRPGWVEHRPMEILERTCEVVSAALDQAGITAHDLAAVGVTNQRETTIVWDKRTGEPYYNAIVWQDTRTKEICQQLDQSTGEAYFRTITGLPLATYFSGPKIKWILDNVTGVREAAIKGHALFGNVDSWLIWWLTGGPNGGAHITDVTNASRTLLMDLNKLDWDDDLLALLSIPRQMLPRIVSSSDPQSWGTTVANGAFGGCVPVCGDLGDQQAALVGQACFQPGEAKNTYGTGCFMLMNTGTVPVSSSSGLLTTVAYRLGSQPAAYALEGSIAIAGALVQWLRDNLGLIRKSDEVEDLARSVDDNGGIYIVPAFSGLFAPHWRSDARGVIVGLTSYINKGHIARAALEATAYQTREVLEAMRKDSGVELSALKVDGGMVVDELLMEFQADLLGVPVVRARTAESTALGAAYAAGLAVNYWSNTDELQKNWQADRIWRPHMDAATRQHLFEGWLRAVERTLNWVYS